MSKKYFPLLSIVFAIIIMGFPIEGIGQGYSITINKAGGGAGTVTSSPPGIQCPDDCTETFGSGKKITLRAKPASDSYFAGWSGACSGTKSCAILMGADSEVTATFEKKVPQISTSPDFLDFGSVDPGKKVKRVLSISNVGTGDLRATISIEGEGLSFSGRSSIVIRPDRNYNLNVTYKKPIEEEAARASFYSAQGGDILIWIGKVKIGWENGEDTVDVMELVPLVGNSLEYKSYYLNFAPK